MIWLVIGVVVWSAVHLVPSVARGLRARLIAALGENGYKIGFALLIVASIAAMVVGWRSTAASEIYVSPAWSGPVATVLMVVAFLLFGASHGRTRIKRLIRHPQLSSVVVWAAAHLIASGDSRSIVLFGGLGLWALVEMVLINRREGAWVKPDVPAIGVELRGTAISLAIFAVVFLLHPYFTGVSLIPA